MKGIRRTFALAVAVLAIGVPAAAAAPDGYQPQLHSDDAQPDAFMRALHNAPSNGVADVSDAVLRHLRDHAPAAGGVGNAALHPDSSAVRPGVVGAEETASSGKGTDWATGGIGLGAGLLLAALAVGTSATSGRRRLVLR